MKLLKLLGALVVLLLLALLVVGLYIDDIAKTAIETGATEALGVATTVGSCHVGLLRGTFKLEELQVANPEGFGTDPFLTLRKGGVSVSAGSLREDVVELPELTLDGTVLRIVQNAGGSNYAKILENLERFQGPAKEPASQPKPEAEGAAEDGKRFIIRTLLLTDIRVVVVPDSKIGLGALDLPIDRIELKDVGSDSDRGVLLSELAGIVVKAILDRAVSSGQLPAMIQGALGGKLRDLGRSLEGEAKTRLDGAAKDASKRLKGLLGR